jgi:hypothetical protein
MAAGIRVFESLEEAQAAGFTFYEKRPDGVLVRRDDGHAFALALVRAPKKEEEREEPPSA